MFTLTPFPLYSQIGKNASEPPNSQTQLLDYWWKSVTVFETMKVEEIKILPPLFLSTDSWLGALALYKPLDSSWRGRGAQFFMHEPTVFPSLLAENKSPPFYFLQTLSTYFSGFSAQRRPRFWLATCLPAPQSLFASSYELYVDGIVEHTCFCVWLSQLNFVKVVRVVSCCTFSLFN